MRRQSSWRCTTVSPLSTAYITTGPPRDEPFLYESAVSTEPIGLFDCMSTEMLSSYRRSLPTSGLWVLIPLARESDYFRIADNLGLGHSLKRFKTVDYFRPGMG